MKNITMLEKISSKAYKQSIENYNTLINVSSYYNEGLNDINDIAYKLKRLKNHIIMYDTLGYYTMILTISGKLNTMIEDFKKGVGIHE